MKVLATATSIPPAESTIDPRFEHLNRWSHLMMQIFESKQFLELAESTHKVHERSSLDELLTQQGLFRAFLLSYSKCFSTSGKGRSSLDPNKVFAIAPEDLIVHQRLMALRNTFAAHNDNSGLDDAVIYVEEREEEFLITHRYAIANPLHEYDSYRSAIALLESYIVKQLNKALDSLERSLGKRVRVNHAV